MSMKTSKPYTCFTTLSTCVTILAVQTLLYCFSLINGDTRLQPDGTPLFLQNFCRLNGSKWCYSKTKVFHDSSSCTAHLTKQVSNSVIITKPLQSSVHQWSWFVQYNLMRRHCDRLLHSPYQLLYSMMQVWEPERSITTLLSICIKPITKAFLSESCTTGANTQTHNPVSFCTRDINRFGRK